MMSSSDFHSLVVAPAAKQFRTEPTSLLHAYTVIWSIDAYASHIALERAPTTAINDAKKRKGVEDDYKNSLTSSSKAGSWEFRVVREVSNAGKHAMRSNTKLGVETSSALKSRSIEGWLWYFMGAHRQHWGNQIIVDLDLQRDSKDEVWLDRDGQPFQGPISREVSIYGLIEPSVGLIQAGP